MRWVDPWSQAAADAIEGDDPQIIGSATLPSGPEAVAALQPDLIIAIFSYISEEEYTQYAEIAPTIVGSSNYPNDGTPWQEQTLTIGTALGKSEQAQQLVDDAEAKVAEVAARNPEFAQATVVPGAAIADGQAAIFPTGRPGSAYRGGAYGAGYLIPALGFEVPEEFDTLGDSTTTALISLENFDLLDRDLIFWAFSRSSGSGETLNATSTYSRLEAVREGREVYTSDDVGTAVHFSTVLSLPYVLDNIEPQLEAALDGDPATSSEPTQ